MTIISVFVCFNNSKSLIGKVKMGQSLESVKNAQARSFFSFFCENLMKIHECHLLDAFKVKI
jgi:hypothetical protein